MSYLYLNGTRTAMSYKAIGRNQPGVIPILLFVYSTLKAHRENSFDLHFLVLCSCSTLHNYVTRQGLQSTANEGEFLFLKINCP